MDLEEIIKIIKIINDSYISKFEYRDNKLGLKLCKDNSIYTDKSTGIEEAAATLDRKKYFYVKSKYVGRIKLLNKNNGFKPYIEVNQVVNRGDLLCVIECLRIPIEIKSDVLGKVEKINVYENMIVDYGKDMFVISCN